jgi:hypothetical protein
MPRCVTLSRLLGDSQKHRQCPIHADNSVLVQPSDGRANPLARYCLNLIHHHLRTLAKTIVGARLDRNAQQWRGAKVAGHGQDSHTAKGLEEVRLNNERRTRLSVSTWENNGNEVAPPHFQPSVSATRESHFSVLASPRLLRSVKHWRRHSAANPARRVSGTQICTGRNPAARRAILCFRTRCATGREAIEFSWYLLHVTIRSPPVTCNNRPGTQMGAPTGCFIFWPLGCPVRSRA